MYCTINVTNDWCLRMFIFLLQSFMSNLTYLSEHQAFARGEEMYSLKRNAGKEFPALLWSIKLHLHCSVIEKRSEIRFVHLSYMKHIFS